MRFQLKLIIIYATFMFAVAIIIGILFYQYSVQQYVENELKRMESISAQTMNQILEIVDIMKYRTDTLLSDPNTLNSLRVLSHTTNYSEEYIRDAREHLQKSLITDSVMSKFHRVIVFNRFDEYIATRSVKVARLKSKVNWEDMPWLEKVDENKGKPVLVATHKDIWGAKENEIIFSLIRAVQGSNMGYIEVQQTIEELSQRINLPDELIDVIILVNKSELLYTNIQDFSYQDYKLLIEDEAFVLGVENIHEQGNQLISKMQSDLYDLNIILMKSEINIKKDNQYLLTMVFIIVVIFYCITLIFVILLALFLTKPLKKLRKVMEMTELSTIDCNVVVETSSDEIMALSLTYQNVLERLKNTLEEEKQLLMLQMEAQYDLLQAQVNPHFLFNVLNVISNKGLIHNDESICEICGNLADMLRYSTNVKDKYATIESEIDYVKQYLNILSTRYEHKLEFNVSCDEHIKDKMIPKITIQQFVENSINHGFNTTSRIMKIDIVASMNEAGWSIRIEDNGCGFSEQVIKNFTHQFEMIKKKITKSTGNIELEIGGMGLPNTFARLYLLYGDQFDFIIESKHIGASVEIIIREQR